MFLQLILIYSIAVPVQPTTQALKQVPYTNFQTSIADFGYDWSYFQYKQMNSGPFIQLQFKNSSGLNTLRNVSISPEWTKIYGILNSSNYPYVLGSNGVNMSQAGQGENIATSTLNSPFLHAALFGPNCGVICSPNSTKIQIIDLNHPVQTSNLYYHEYDCAPYNPLLVQADATGSSIFVYVSTQTIYRFNLNLTLQQQITSHNQQYSSISHLSLHFDAICNCLVRTTNHFAIVHYLSNSSSLTVNVTVANINYPMHSLQFNQALICQNSLIILTNTQVLFYNITDSNFITGFDVNVSRPVTPKTSKLKCFANQGQFGFIVQNQLNSTQTFIVFYNLSQILQTTYYHINSTNHIVNPNNTNNTNLTNIANLTNNTNITNNSNMANFINNTNNISFSNITKLNNNNLSNSLQPNNAFIQIIMSKMLSSEFKNSTQNAVSIISLISLSPIGRFFTSPFINVLQDFWFYKFHQIQYLQFVQIFTNQVDVLNQLRIKPNFLKFNFTIRKLQQQNKKYQQSSLLQPRAPQNIFMLSSTFNIYGINIPIAILQYLALYILSSILGSLKKSIHLFQIFHDFFKSYSFMYVLYVTAIEPNVAPFSFFGSIQYNVFISFDFFCKINLIFTVFSVFTIFIYSFAIHLIIIKYELKKYAKKMFDVSKFNLEAIWLQILLKCLRNLCQGVIHGSFINNHQIQLILLIIFDALLVLIILNFRVHYSSKVIFILSFIYLCTFLAFDMLLYIFSYHSTHSSQTFLLVLNNLTVIVVITLFLVTFLIMIANFILVCMEIIKYIIQLYYTKQQKCKNKLQNKNAVNRKQPKIMEQICLKKELATNNKIKHYNLLQNQVRLNTTKMQMKQKKNRTQFFNNLIKIEPNSNKKQILKL